MAKLFTEYLGFNQRITFNSNYCRILSGNIWTMSDWSRQNETSSPDNHWISRRYLWEAGKFVFYFNLNTWSFQQ